VRTYLVSLDRPSNPINHRTLLGFDDVERGVGPKEDGFLRLICSHAQMVFSDAIDFCSLVRTADA
jgi:hypothetical protein